MGNVEEAYAAEDSEQVVATDNIPIDYSRASASSSSLTITPAASGGHGASNSETTMAYAGKVAYRAHDVAVSVTDSLTYALQVSYSSGNTALGLEGGNKTFKEVSSTGVAGESMPANQWGYAWINPTDADNTAQYYPMPAFNTAGSTLPTGGLEVGSTGADKTFSTTKKLIFAASFPPDTISGHYITSVLLSLSATASDVTKLSELNTMQAMTPSICENSPVGDYNLSVADARDSKTYGVVKLANGECWMASNLALDLYRDGAQVKLNPEDSNVTTANTTVNTGAPAFWNNKTGTPIKYFDGSGQSTHKPFYGYYYTFDAATAGQFTKQTSGTASQDICPKGWRLPMKTEYDNTVVNKGTWGAIKNPDTSAITNGGNGYVLTGVNPAYNLSFPAAGGIDPNGGAAIGNAGTSGAYWSSGIDNGSNAYRILVYDKVAGTDKTLRYYGYSVRCIAKNAKDLGYE